MREIHWRIGSIRGVIGCDFGVQTKGRRSMNEKTPFTNLDTDVQKTVAVDLDGCLAYYDGWRGPDHIGPPIHSMALVCHKLHERGFRIVLNTCRLNKTNNREHSVDTDQSLSTIRDWLNDNGLSFVAISLDEGKPFAHVYVDDRAVSFNENLSGGVLLDAILEALDEKILA